ncbi:MAG: hypothetical protein S4CHLAM102_15090 [Chlamydiia bacterium]|nr:hypothetical protein [Chlamydiia bacterium]
MTSRLSGLPRDGVALIAKYLEPKQLPVLAGASQSSALGVRDGLRFCVIDLLQSFNLPTHHYREGAKTNDLFEQARVDLVDAGPLVKNGRLSLKAVMPPILPKPLKEIVEWKVVLGAVREVESLRAAWVKCMAGKGHLEWAFQELIGLSNSELIDQVNAEIAAVLTRDRGIEEGLSHLESVQDEALVCEAKVQMARTLAVRGEWRRVKELIAGVQGNSLGDFDGERQSIVTLAIEQNQETIAWQIAAGIVNPQSQSQSFGEIICCYAKKRMYPSAQYLASHGPQTYVRRWYYNQMAYHAFLNGDEEVGCDFLVATHFWGEADEQLRLIARKLAKEGHCHYVMCFSDLIANEEAKERLLLELVPLTIKSGEIELAIRWLNSVEHRDAEKEQVVEKLMCELIDHEQVEHALLFAPQLTSEQAKERIGFELASDGYYTEAAMIAGEGCAQVRWVLEAAEICEAGYTSCPEEHEVLHLLVESAVVDENYPAALTYFSKVKGNMKLCRRILVPLALKGELETCEKLCQLIENKAERADIVIQVCKEIGPTAPHIAFSFAQSYLSLGDQLWLYSHILPSENQEMRHFFISHLGDKEMEGGWIFNVATQAARSKDMRLLTPLLNHTVLKEKCFDHRDQLLLCGVVVAAEYRMLDEALKWIGEIEESTIQYEAYERLIWDFGGS